MPWVVVHANYSFGSGSIRLDGPLRRALGIYHNRSTFPLFTS